MKSSSSKKQTESNSFFFRPFLQPLSRLVPVDSTTYACSYAVDSSLDLINDVFTTLNAQGIALDLYHPEAGPGQHEFVLKYTDVLSIADKEIGTNVSPFLCADD